MPMNRMLMKKFAALALLSGCAIAGPASADMPSMQRVKQEQTYAFGDIRIKQTFNSMTDPMSPDFMVQVYKKDELLLQLKDAAYTTFHASPGNSVFVGLSNGGWPGTAVIIFNRDGKILLLADHNRTTFDYCMSTATLLRQWYDPTKVQLKFPRYGRYTGAAPGITMRNCRGETIDLLDLVAKSSAQATADLRKEIHLRAGLR